MTTSTLDLVFATLSDPQRRLVCRRVADADGDAVPLEDLIAFVADDPAAFPDSEPRCDRRSRVETRLHHVHLPKLDDAAIVEYDREMGSVTADSSFPIAMDLLRTAADAPEATPDVRPLE